jgi:hypothetical protein
MGAMAVTAMLSGATGLRLKLKIKKFGGQKWAMLKG